MVEVVHIEIVGIQEFIFRSRTLIDTIGRSHQVQKVTSEVFMISGAAARGWPENALSVEFAGAGRVSVVVREDPDFTAERLVAWYSRALADISDALQPVVVIDHCDDDQAIAESIVNAPRSLHRRRHETLPTMAGEAPLGALLCAVSGAAAERVIGGTAVADEVGTAEDWGKKWHRWQEECLLAGVDERWRSHLALPTLTRHARTQSRHVQPGRGPCRRSQWGRRTVAPDRY